MLSFIFDTETTGRIERHKDLAHKDQPDIIQLCGRLDSDGTTLSHVNLFVDGEREIAPDAFETHRISRELTRSIGVSRRVMCMVANDMIRKADVVVGHNVDFDIKMLLISMGREGGTGQHVRKAAQYCTMKNSTDLVKIPSNFKSGEYKWPTLAEAYEKLVDPRGFTNAHDAEADVTACQELYHAIRTKSD